MEESFYNRISKKKKKKKKQETSSHFLIYLKSIRVQEKLITV